MKRNKFSLSNYKLGSFDMGTLYPLGFQEVVPGDTFQHSTSLLVRVLPLQSPVMHPIQVRVHHWFVPYRLIWDDFEDFITGGPDGNDASVHPVRSGTYNVGSLMDYLGCPTSVALIGVNALPPRAYNLIYNEWYRDQDLVTEATIDTTSGTDTTTNLSLHQI